MKINIFKFGGASVNNAAGFRRVAGIIGAHSETPLVVVVSALGKTTNALEEVLGHYMNNDPVELVESYRKVERQHLDIVGELFPDPSHPVHGEVGSIFNQLRGVIRKGHLYTADRRGYDYEYDQIVSFGELISSAILYHYLVQTGMKATLADVRELILTDATYRDAKVNWEKTTRNISAFVRDKFDEKKGFRIVVTQGFLGSDSNGNTTTLGREGSDFSAAIFAYALNAGEMTIWKDVPGVMNADPRWMPDAVKLDLLSYREAIELAYYGASVIHPKTIRPLENAGITLSVKSFNEPDAPGTRIEKVREWHIGVPIFIRKQGQVLISLSPRDFSFVMEENLSHIFRILAENRIKVNLMHNSAISFSFCTENDTRRITPLLTALTDSYETRYNEGCTLYTIRHYSSEEAIKRVTDGRTTLMEVRSRNTVQVVVK